MEAANNFITANLAVLTDGTMPPAFQTTFQNDSDACLEASVTFFAADLAKKQDTSNKLEANLYTHGAVMQMLKDGQQIFKDQPSIKKQFTFAQLKASYKRGTASLAGTITNANNLGIEGVVIASANGLYSATTNKKGYYHISRIAEGTYNFIITCPGYAPTDVTITFTAGVKSKADASLVNTMKKVA